MFKRFLSILLAFTLIISFLPFHSLVAAAQVETGKVKKQEVTKKMEVQQKRSENSKTFINKDGTLTKKVYPFPIHYYNQNAKNGWISIIH